MPAKKTPARRAKAPARKAPTRKAAPAKKKAGLFLSRFNFGKKTAVIMVVLFAVIGTAGTFMARAAQLIDEETVRLSNGKEIRLGQSVKTVSKILGDELFKLNEQQYQYPGKEDQPIEVVMDFDDRGRLVVIHLADNPVNATKATQSRVGMVFDDVKNRTRRAENLSGKIAEKREKGLKIDQRRSSTYLLPEHCSQSDEVGLVSLTLKGHEARLLEDLAGPVCEDPHEHLAE